MESYSIKNIKSFRDKTDIRLKPLTIFVGKNSCGKSSLIRFPVVLAQTYGEETTGVLKLYGKYLDYGNYEDIVFRHQGSSVEFSVGYRIDLSLAMRRYYGLDEAPTTCYEEVVIKTTINKVDKKIIIEKNEIVVGGVLRYGLYRTNRGWNARVFYTYDKVKKEFTSNEYSLELNSSDVNERGFLVLVNPDMIRESVRVNLFPNIDKEDLIVKRDGMDDISIVDFIRWDFIDEPIEISDEINAYIKVASAYEYYTSMIGAIRQCYRSELRDISYIGPFRNDPERLYRDEEIGFDRVGPKGEHAANVLIRNYQESEGLISEISSWLTRTMGYSLVVDKIDIGLFRILLRDDMGNESNLMDVGYGVSQILPILIQAILKSNRQKTMYGYMPDDLLIIEQPELHLHPAAQSELADFFALSVLEAKKKILIETHSEHLIRKLQVLVSDPNCKLTCEDVAIYYVDKDEEGAAYVKTLEMLPNGKFAEKWPSGFFDKAHELSMELLRNQ